MVTIIEYSKTKTHLERQHDRSKARSHAAAFAHHRRRSSTPPKLCTQVQSVRPVQELRSLAFFRERTSVQWPGWSDSEFWSSIVPCVASSYPHVFQSLGAIADYHEALETGDPARRRLSVTQGYRAIATMNTGHSSTPMSVILVSCMITAALSGIVNDHIFFQALKTQFGLLEDITDDEFSLIPLLKRQRSRICQMLDPLSVLRLGAVEDSVPIITAFQTLLQARDCLEQVLNNAAHQVKSGRPLNKSHLADWLTAFNDLRSQVTFTGWLGLRAAYGMSLVQVETLYSDNEMVYDQYLETYRDVADVLEITLNQESRAGKRFGIDGGFVSMARWASNWCRHPPLRARLIALQRLSHLMEDVEGTQHAAVGCELLRRLEEDGIHPAPTCCADIPESARVRHHTSFSYNKAKMRRLDFLRSPYTGPVESMWSSYDSNHDYQCEDNASTTTSEVEPDFVMGPGYRSVRQADGSYYTMKAPEFYFAIPKI